VDAGGLFVATFFYSVPRTGLDRRRPTRRLRAATCPITVRSPLTLVDLAVLIFFIKSHRQPSSNYRR